mgnify:CR=1 FL=1
MQKQAAPNRSRVPSVLLSHPVWQMPIVWLSQITALSAHGKGGAFRAFPLRQGLFSASIPIGPPPPLTAQGRTDSCEGPCPGRHMGRPLQIQLKPPSTPGGAGGDGAPPLPSYQGAKQRADVGIGPYGTKGRPHRPPWPVAQGGASAPAVARGGWDMQQRASPKCPATSGNPSVALRATAPFAQGSLALRGGTLSPPGFQRLMDAALGSVGADLRVGPWAGPAKRRVRADT